MSWKEPLGLGSIYLFIYFPLFAILAHSYWVQRLQGIVNCHGYKFIHFFYCRLFLSMKTKASSSKSIIPFACYHGSEENSLSLKCAIQ